MSKIVCCPSFIAKREQTISCSNKSKCLAIALVVDGIGLAILVVGILGLLASEGVFLGSLSYISILGNAGSIALILFGGAIVLESFINFCFIYYFSKCRGRDSFSKREKVRIIDSDFLKAVEKNNIAQVKILFSRGANMNIPADEPALFRAACGGHYEMMLLLIQAGAAIKMRDFTNKSILIKVAEQKTFTQDQKSWLFQEFVHAGVNVNEKGPLDDYTALHYAAAFNEPEVVDMLLSLGADPRIQSRNGTPRDITESPELKEILLTAEMEFNRL